MAEYIEREYVLKCMEDSYKNAGISAEAKAKMTRWLNKAPAADVRPVVLCRDCKNDCHCMIQDFMEDYGITPDNQNNFFCGYGEKEDKKDER